MRAVVQRVREAAVYVEEERLSAIDAGLLVFLGIGKNDGQEDVRFLANKLANVRLFPGPKGDIDTSLQDNPGYAMLLVSQFTLFGDTRKGRRPSFINAAAPDRAIELYEYFLEALEDTGVPFAAGKFQAMMDIKLVNWGPVTLLFDSKKEF